MPQRTSALGFLFLPSILHHLGERLVRFADNTHDFVSVDPLNSFDTIAGLCIALFVPRLGKECNDAVAGLPVAPVVYFCRADNNRRADNCTGELLFNTPLRGRLKAFVEQWIKE